MTNKYFWSYQICMSQTTCAGDVSPMLVEMLQKQYNEGFDTLRGCYDFVGQLVWLCMRQHLVFSTTTETIEVEGRKWNMNMHIKVRVQ